MALTNDQVRCLIAQAQYRGGTIKELAALVDNSESAQFHSLIAELHAGEELSRALEIIAESAAIEALSESESELRLAAMRGRRLVTQLLDYEAEKEAG